MCVTVHNWCVETGGGHFQNCSTTFAALANNVETFEMWYYKKMLKIKQTDHIRNEIGSSNILT